MWLKYLPLATFAYNTFNTPNLGNHIPNELIFGRKPRSSLNLDSNPDIKVSGTFKEYYGYFRCLLPIETVDVEVKIKMMRGIHTSRRDWTTQVISCNPCILRLCPYPSLIRMMKTYLELESKLGNQPCTNVFFCLTQILCPERPQHPRRLKREESQSNQ